MNTEHRGLLIAMSLGDGYIARQKLGACNIVIEHSQNQLEYLQHKAKLINSIFGGKYPTIYTRERLDARTAKVYKQCSFAKGDNYFKLLHRWIYCNNNKKTYTKQILDMLTPHGIAIWYMDDGCCKLYTSKKTNKISCCQTYIATHCSETEAKLIQEYFQTTHGIDFKVYKRNSGLCEICTNTTGSKKFVELIRPYVIESMKYKIRHVPETLYVHECPTPAMGEDIG